MLSFQNPKLNPYEPFSVPLSHPHHRANLPLTPRHHPTRMDPDSKPRPAGIDPGHEPSLVGAELYSNTNRRTTAGPSASRSNHNPNALRQDNRNNDHHDHTAQDYRRPHLQHGRLTMPNTWTRSTSYSGPSSLPEAHTSGLGASPICATKPAHRNPYQYWQSHPHLVSTGLQRSSSGDRLQKGGNPPFSPPFLHPLSHRTKLSRTQSPLPTSLRRSRDSQRPRAKFTIGSSRPNSPMEPEPKPRSAPTRFPSPFTIRGFLALSTFSKVVAVLFVCCFFVLARAFFGGHNPEKCGVCARTVTDPGPRSGPVLGSSGAGMDTKDPRFYTEDRMMPDRRVGDEQVRVWIERFDKMYGDRYGWKAGEYEVVHDDDGDSDEYEHEDLTGPA